MLNVLELLFPKCCLGCGKKLLQRESLLCTQCRHEMPLACFHRTGDPSLKNRFYGRFPLENATALTYFSKKELRKNCSTTLNTAGTKNFPISSENGLGQNWPSCPNTKMLKW